MSLIPFPPAPTDGSCVMWSGHIDRDGYGHTRKTTAHRVAYELAKGPIPDGLEIDHLCRNRACVNPNHLEAVTHAENVRRSSEAQTHCINGHEFTPENTRIHTDRLGRTHRACRACACVSSRRYYAKKKKATP